MLIQVMVQQKFVFNKDSESFLGTLESLGEGLGHSSRHTNSAPSRHLTHTCMESSVGRGGKERKPEAEAKIIFEKNH